MRYRFFIIETRCSIPQLMHMKLGIVIQARIGSTRLPGKILKYINGKPLVLYICERLRRIDYDLPIIVATTDSKADDCWIDVLRSNNISFVRGCEQNVLRRYLTVAEQFGLTHIMRVCADNPFIDIEYCNRLLELFYREKDKDYYSFSYKQKPVILSHFGIFTEIAGVKALQEINDHFPEYLPYHEHVTSGLYLNKEVYDIRLEDITGELVQFDGIRCTIDTQEDYDNVKTLIEKADYSEHMNFATLAALITNDTTLMKKMSIEVMDNQK